MMIKHEKHLEIKKDVQTLSETLIKQFVLVEDLLLSTWKENNYEQFLENEALINSMTRTTLLKLTGIVIQFSPKGKDLRTIVYCHEMLLHTGAIGNFLNDTVTIIKESDLKSEECSEYKGALSKIFGLIKETTEKSYFSFYNEDNSLANRIIQQAPYEEINELIANTRNAILVNFEEIPLLKQELINLMAFDKLFFIMKKMEDIVIDMAKSTIFVTQGSLENA